MKQRYSIHKAEWSKTKEEQFRKECKEILLLNGAELLFDNNKIYLKSGEEKTLLIQVEKPKSTWYEVWLKLKYP